MKNLEGVAHFLDTSLNMWAPFVVLSGAQNEQLELYWIWCRLQLQFTTHIMSGLPPKSKRTDFLPIVH